jgi:N-methylhydantoinase B/oxoprolinase/acetone carboxylase alpha subunit
MTIIILSKRHVHATKGLMGGKNEARGHNYMHPKVQWVEKMKLMDTISHKKRWV